MSENEKQNDGTGLEAIVAMIEGMGLPPGFTLEQRKRVYDDDRMQVAELDIVISGKVGTTTWTTVFECRDRPSAGPAPIEWIEQLIGRKDRLNLGSIVAVSSTGFSAGAVKLAATRGIHLRTFQELSSEELTSFLPVPAPIQYGNICLKEVQVVLIPDDNVTFQVKEECIKNKGSGAMESILGFCQRVVEEQGSFEKMGPGETKRVAFSIGPNVLARYSVRKGEKEYELAALEFTVQLFRTPLTLQLTKVGSYVGEDGSRLSDVVEWTGHPDSPIKGLTVVGTLKQPQHRDGAPQ